MNIDELKITPDILTEGLDKFNNELVNLECDLPFVDRQYSEIIYKLIQDELIDIPSLKWMNDTPDEESSDIFVKIFIRLVELKFLSSEHDQEETMEFVEKHQIKKILDRIMKYLLEEDLIANYKEEAGAHEMIYKILGFVV